MLKVKQALEEGHSIEEIYNQTNIDPWFLYQINKLSVVIDNEKNNDLNGLKHLKRNGYSDYQIAQKWKKSKRLWLPERPAKPIACFSTVGRHCETFKPS